MTRLMPVDSPDVLVVGGGPAGAYAAWRLAADGFAVVVCEEHRTIGDPVHCTGVLATETFDDFGVPRDAIVNSLFTVNFVSPGGFRVSYGTADAHAVVIDRGRFDRDLAARAAEAGADIRTNARVTSLDVDAHGVTAIAGGSRIRARLAVLACGANYFLQRRFNLGLPSAYLHSAQRELPVERLGDVELHFGASVAPGGFAWAVPVLRDGGRFVRVGAMARRAPVCYAAMASRIGVSWGIESINEPPRQKILPLGPIQRTVGDRLLVVGDAAGLVKPTTGGGIYYSLMSAALAADVAAPALRHNRLRAADLADYERQWRRRIDDELDSQSALRKIAERMTDGEIDALFELAQTDGIMPLVRRTARFNQHRHLIRALLQHPPARRVLLRAMVS